MASSDTTAMDLLLECTICLCHFTDPRTLPCLHTFCLRCLNDHVKASRVGTKFSCPSCRRDCVIPPKGIQAFPKNFVMNTLSDMMTKATLSFIGNPQSETTPSGEPTRAAGAAGQCANWEVEDPHGEAVVFCSECGHNFCAGCRDAHKMFPSTRKHVLTAIPAAAAAGQQQHQEQLKDAPASPTHAGLPITLCQVHHDMALTVYCKTCSQPLCKTCVNASHKKHKLERLANAVANCRSELEEMDEPVAELLAYHQEALKQLSLRDAQIKESIAVAGAEVDATADRLCEQIRGQQDALKKRIADMGKEALNKTVVSISDIEAGVAHLESICSYRTNLEEHGREVDLIRHTPALREQLSKIQRSQIQTVDMDLTIDRLPPSVECLQVGSASLKVQQKQVLTESKTTTPQVTRPRLLYGIKLTTKVCVTGLALVGRHLCVTNSESPNIWVYAPEGRHIKNIRVPDLDRPTAMARLSDVKRRLVIVENSMLPEKKQLHSLTLTNEMNLKKHTPMKVQYTPEGVSVDNYGNVIVTSSIPKQLIIYDPKMIIKTIVSITDPTISQPVAAVRADYGYSVVDFSNSHVALLDEQGQVIHKFGQDKKLLHPQHVVHHPSGLLVADRDKHRVLLLTQELPFQQHFIQAVNTPTCLFWDHNTERLYVGQEGGTAQSVVKVYTWQAIQSLPQAVQHSVQTLPATLTHQYSLNLRIQQV